MKMTEKIKRILVAALAAVTLLTVFAAIPVYGLKIQTITTISIDTPAYEGRKRLTLDEIILDDENDPEYGLWYTALELVGTDETGDVVWTKDTVFGEVMGENEVYESGKTYYASFKIRIKESMRDEYEFDSNISQHVFGQDGTANVEVMQTAKYELWVRMKVRTEVEKVTLHITKPVIDGVMTFGDVQFTLPEGEDKYSVSSVDWRTLTYGEVKKNTALKQGQYLAVVKITEIKDHISWLTELELLGVNNCEVENISEIVNGLLLTLRFEMYNWIDTVSMGFDITDGGKIAGFDYGLSNENCYLDLIWWYDRVNAGNITENPDFTMSKDGEYRITLAIKPKDTYIFSPDVVFEWTGSKDITASITWQGSDFINLEILYEKAVIDGLDLQMSAPIHGNKPSNIIEEKDGKVAVTVRYWLDEEGNSLPSSATFEEGKTYKVRFEVRPIGRYKLQNLYTELHVNEMLENCYVNGALVDSGYLTSYNPSKTESFVLSMTFVAAPPHTHTYENNVYGFYGDKHWIECDSDTCPDKYGSRKDTAEHDFGETIIGDAEGHGKGCACGAIIDSAPHSGGAATCTEAAICEVCGYHYGEKLSHSFTEKNGYRGEDGHADLCSCGEKGAVTAHSDEDKNGSCDGCGCEVAIEPVEKLDGDDTGVPEDDEKNNGWVIALTVTGAVLLTAGAAAAVWFLRKKQNAPGTAEKSEASDGATDEENPQNNDGEEN